MSIPRIFARPLPTTPDLSIDEVRVRLRHHWDRLDLSRASRIDAAPAATFDRAGIKSFDEIDAILDTVCENSPSNTLPDGELDRLESCAARFVAARAAKVEAILAGLRAEDRPLVRKALGRGIEAGVVDRHRMHEIIAGLHARSPWMAPAATIVMREMEHATQNGPAHFHAPPIILLGGPGIGKSRWARDLARAFSVPSIEVDVGAANGAVFALSGTERGWGSAGMGRIVRSLLTDHIINPLVIIDEVDKIPSSISSTRSTLPGAAEVLKSMIEPETARAWICPYLQLPFDLTGLSWVLTTNSLDGIPAPLIDRCHVVRIPDPTVEQLHIAATAMIAEFIADTDLRRWLGREIRRVIERRTAQGHRTSLRQIGRLVDRISGAATAPWVN